MTTPLYGLPQPAVAQGGQIIDGHAVHRAPCSISSRGSNSWKLRGPAGKRCCRPEDVEHAAPLVPFAVPAFLNHCRTYHN